MIAISQSLRSLPGLAEPDGGTENGKVAREFESMMMAQMLRFGSKPLFGENSLDGGSAGRMARDQLFTQLAMLASRGNGFGLASQLEVEMSKGSQS